MSLMDSIFARVLCKQTGSSDGNAPAYLDAAAFGIEMGVSANIELTAEQVETFQTAVSSLSSGVRFAMGDGYAVFHAVNYVNAMGFYMLGGSDATTGAPWSLMLNGSTLTVSFGSMNASAVAE